MWVRHHAAACHGGARAVDGSAWDVDGEVYPINPRLLVQPGTWETVRLWDCARGGAGLPEAGGAGEQAAVMLDAFEVLEEAEQAVRAAARAADAAPGTAGRVLH